MTKTKLEKVLEYIIAKKEDKARALLHEFFVEKARAIHEELMQDEDIAEGDGCDEIEREETDENIEEMAFETMFGENDLMDQESPADAAQNIGADMGGGEAPAGDEPTDAPVDDNAAGGDMGGEKSEDEKMADLKQKLSDLQAAFDALAGNTDKTGEGFEGMMGMGEGGDEEEGGESDFDFMGAEHGSPHDEEGEEHHGDGSDVIPDGDDDDEGMDGDGPIDFGSEDEDEDGMGSPHHSSHGDEEEEDETDESFLEDMDLESMMNEDGLTESILDELETVHVNMTGGEIGSAGTKFTPNNTSPLCKNRNAGAAKPVSIKSDEHSGYNRETAPTSKQGTGAKSPKNIQKNWDSNLEQKKKEGDSSALLNNKGSGYGAENNKSPLTGVTRPTIGSTGKKK